MVIGLVCRWLEFLFAAESFVDTRWPTLVETVPLIPFFLSPNPRSLTDTTFFLLLNK
ncbi:hypothetical protein PISMIDRAFT_576781 [Pisolithus microcarpus 441]|uniref:Unplaced genomic scaffold scaffold_76, whole genome shotgun sequence n=1 Tax=Pisolithus microcarpus 441 TaxID=765257 RepID=A0A0C9ZE59_9AGAM|nr:hypothetical protein PISMIDRAFT_576781 [Pisolithus microcarpus 441]